MSRAFFDIRYSARKFARSPGLAFALLLTIALGVGSNVSVYGFILGLTKSDLPLASAGRVVSIFGQDAHREGGPLTYKEYLLVKRCRDAFEWIGVARIAPGVTEVAKQSAIVSVAALTSDLANALNLSLGKGVVVSHYLWQNELGAEANIRGEEIRISGADARVSGVAPTWLEGLYRDRDVDVWMPLEERSLEGDDRSRRNLWVLARLRPGVSIRQAQTAIRSNRDASGEMRVLPYTGMTPEMEDGMSRISTLLRFAAGAVFFIACANIASFLLERAFA